MLVILATWSLSRMLESVEHPGLHSKTPSPTETKWEGVRWGMQAVEPENLCLNLHLALRSNKYTSLCKLFNLWVSSNLEIRAVLTPVGLLDKQIHMESM